MNEPAGPTLYYLFPEGKDFKIEPMMAADALKLWDQGKRWVDVPRGSPQNRPVEDCGKLLGNVSAVTAMLDRLLHYGHVLKCGPRSWRTKTAAAAGEVKE